MGTLKDSKVFIYFGSDFKSPVLQKKFRNIFPVLKSLISSKIFYKFLSISKSIKDSGVLYYFL